jgi:hypothetical protein
MARHILFAGFVAAAASLLPADNAQADHCYYGSGYPIGAYSVPSVRVYGGATYYSMPSYYSPGYSFNSYPAYSYGFGGYPAYGYGYSSSPSLYYSRPGFSISIGSGFGRSYYGSSYGYGYRPSYGYSSRSGIGFNFGGGFYGHRHHH